MPWLTPSLVSVSRLQLHIQPHMMRMQSKLSKGIMKTIVFSSLIVSELHQSDLFKDSVELDRLEGRIKSAIRRILCKPVCRSSCRTDVVSYMGLPVMGDCCLLILSERATVSWDLFHCPVTLQQLFCDFLHGCHM